MISTTMLHGAHNRVTTPSPCHSSKPPCPEQNDQLSSCRMPVGKQRLPSGIDFEKAGLRVQDVVAMTWRMWQQNAYLSFAHSNPAI